MYFAKNRIGRVEIGVILLVILVLGFILYPVCKQNMTYLKPFTFDRAKAEAESKERTMERMRKRSNQCLSNLHQLAMGAEMYAQDHHDFMPGVNKINKNGTATYTGWAVNINKYLKGVSDVNTSNELFTCPETNSDLETPICYGYNSSLLNNDGTGINISAIKNPDQVGMLCDSIPGIPFTATFASTKDYKFIGGGIVGGYSLVLPREEKWGRRLSVEITPRHYNVVNIAYADGHVTGVPGNYNWKDPDNNASRAFYRCSILGLVDNPGAGLGGGVDIPFGDIAAPERSHTVIGGDPVTRPILIAACEVQKKMAPGFGYKDDGFKGSLSTGWRPSDYLEGVDTGAIPAANQHSNIQIGKDYMVVIVNKNCAIKVPGFDFDLTKKVKEKKVKTEKFWRLITKHNLQTIINSDGYGMLNSAAKGDLPANYTATRHDWQLYVQNKTDGTRSAIAATIGNFYVPGGFGAYFRDGGTRDHKSYAPRTRGATRNADVRTYRGIYCNSDIEIINKVANDPLGIGIVSAAFVDTQKVDILAVDMNNTNHWAATYPMDNKYNLYEGMADGENWPFQRKLYAVYGKVGTASEKISTRVFNNGKEAFFAGPLYKSSFRLFPVKTVDNMKPRIGGPPTSPGGPRPPRKTP